MLIAWARSRRYQAGSGSVSEDWCGGSAFCLFGRVVLTFLVGGVAVRWFVNNILEGLRGYGG